MLNRIAPDTKSPSLTLPLVDGSVWSLADQMPLSFTWLLVYRGYGCEHCEAYLQRFQAFASKVEDAGLNVLFASMDSKDLAQRAQSEWGLQDYPVAYGLSVEDAENWGLFVSTEMRRKRKVIMAEPASFLIRGDHRLYMASVSSMPFALPDLGMFITGAKKAMETMYPAQGLGC